MSLKSMNDILGILELEAKWQEQPFQRVLKSWEEIVGAKVAARSRPLSIQRDVLWVATSSAAWAQNLTFQRQSLLLKLNKKLPQPLVDIRFSTAEWKKTPLPTQQEPTLSPQDHPSYLGKNMVMSPLKDSRESANIAFKNWANRRQERSQYLSLCPQCQCPTPPGELQHWGVCSPCRAKLINQGIADS